METLELFAAPLTREAFAPFGDVIQTDGAQRVKINEGTTERFHDLARVDLASRGGYPLINIFRGQPRPQPNARPAAPVGSQYTSQTPSRPSSSTNFSEAASSAFRMRCSDSTPRSFNFGA